VIDFTNTINIINALKPTIIYLQSYSICASI